MLNDGLLIISSGNFFSNQHIGHHHNAGGESRSQPETEATTSVSFEHCSTV